MAHQLKFHCCTHAGAKCRYLKLFCHVPPPVDDKTFAIHQKVEDMHITLVRGRTNFEDSYRFRDNYHDQTYCPPDQPPAKVLELLAYVVPELKLFDVVFVAMLL